MSVNGYYSAHFTMFCMTPREKEQIDSCIADLLAEKVPV
jgi:hypothetical protein